jgi:hypothetical protein
MRRLKLGLGIGVLVTLLTAGVALAKHGNGGTHTDSVAATATVTQTSQQEKTCAGTDSPTYRQFRATSSGTSTGDPRLTGTVRVKAHGLINTTTMVGQVTGSVKIRAANGKLAHAKLLTVFRNGTLHGLIVGRVKDRSTGAAEEMSGSGKLIAPVVVTFSGTTVTLQIGTSAALTNAGVIQKGGCNGNGNGDDDDDDNGDRRKGR